MGFLLSALLLVVVCVAGCSRPAPEPAAPAGSASFDQWTDELTREWARNSPQLATRTQYFSGDDQDALDRQLALVGEWGNTYGVGEAKKRAELATRGLTTLRAFDRNTLTPSQQLTASVVEWLLEDAVGTAQFATHRYVFDQFNGLHLDLVNFLTQTHPIRYKRDVENYLGRLALVSARLDEGIAAARAADEEGIRPPSFIVERTMQQIDGLLKQTGRSNVFVTSLDERLAALGSTIPPSDRAGWVAAAELTVSQSVLPAYGRVRALLAEQLPKSTDEAGVWRLPRGDEFYQSVLATFTTTTMTPDEIHEVGLREVARIEGEMDVLLRQLGFTNGTVNARYQQLNLSIQPKGAGDPRPEILATNVKWVRDAETRADRLFDIRPKAPVDVRREPAFSEKTAAAHYTDPAPDGSRPGVFYLPLPGPTFDLLRTRSLAYHEAVPGHHFQLALQQESAELPRFRRLGVLGDSTPYIEGWGLYAERLADEDGWYDGDPRGRIGYLNSMLFRARRLVVDTGIHAKKWTRQQAIDYGINPQEVERYVAWPGQACAYMIGQLKIVELREKARARRGDKFSIKEFHNAVLKTGSVPLTVLEAELARALP
jgi:uncharacterized protein (DUF885 family)